jgi:hypothetical protein
VLVLDPKPSACFIFGGTNTEVSGLLRDGMIILDEMCNTLMANGIATVLVTLLPRNDSHDPDQHKWNVALRRYADRQGFLLLDANLR